MAPAPIDDERDRQVAAELLLAAIAEASPDVILTVDATAIITSWNPAAERLYGYAPDEAIGQPLSMLAFAAESEEIDRLLASALRGESVRDFSTVRRRRDGSPVEVMLNVAPLRDASGRAVGECVVARDVGPQRAAAAALRRATRSLELAQQEAHLGNFHVDLATGDVELSIELSRLLNWHPAEGHSRSSGRSTSSTRTTVNRHGRRWPGTLPRPVSRAANVAPIPPVDPCAGCDTSLAPSSVSVAIPPRGVGPCRTSRKNARLENTSRASGWSWPRATTASPGSSRR